MKNIIVIIVSMLVVFGSGFYFGKDNEKVIYKTVVETQTQYLPVYDTTYIPNIIYKDTGSHTIKIDSVEVKILIPVDTMAIIKDYLTLKEYSFDTTYTIGRVIDSISVYANQIVKYQQSFNPIIVEYEDKIGFNVGLMVGVDDVTPLINVSYKKFSYIAGYNFVGNNGIRLGITYKIK